MAYKSIRFYNFRNLEDREIELDGNIYYLVGENGAGKSSFIEALYLLSYGASFRERNLEHCVRRKEEPFLIAGQVQTNEQRHQIRVQYQKEGSVGKKQIEVDGKKLQDRKQLLQVAPSIVFAPTDSAYINGSPKDKRQFIDQTISLLDPNYIELSRDYARNLGQRNWVLKNRQMDLLPTYTLQMAELGLEIQRLRARYTAKLSAIFSQIFTQVANFAAPVSLEYQPSWPQCTGSAGSTSNDDTCSAGETGAVSETGAADVTASEHLQSCLAYLEQREQRDLQFGSTQSGPHRDQLSFVVRGFRSTNVGDEGQEAAVQRQEGSKLDFTRLASSGQLRLAALALKSAQAHYLQQSLHCPGILLLDDVLLEMDSGHRKRFLQSLPPSRQVFFTLLPDEEYCSYPFSDYRVLGLQGGAF